MTKKMYEEVIEWQDSVFANTTKLSSSFLLLEEARELYIDILNGEFKTEEIADCFLLLFSICNKSGMSYDDILIAIEQKMHINRARKWGSSNELGYIKHV